MTENFAGFAYINCHYPPVSWNIARGIFHSPDCLDASERGFAISVSMASMLANSSVERLIAEFKLEGVRQHCYPHQVSRLRGLFVFDEIESMANLWENNNWGGHFIDEYITDIGVSCRKSSRVDSNWIGDIVDQNGKLKPLWEYCAHRYWSGVAHPNKEPIWERIIEGAIIVWSMDAKQEALRDIKAVWPDSLGLLSYSINCAHYGSIDGEVFPGWRRTENGISLVYTMRFAESRSPGFIQSLEAFVNANPALGVNLGSGFQTPDLQGYFVELEANDNSMFNQVISQIWRRGEAPNLVMETSDT